MTDETANLILEHLRNLRADIARVETKVEALSDDVTELKHAVSGLAYFLAHTMGRVLDVETRVERLEAR